jgi:hypothetical protein
MKKKAKAAKPKAKVLPADIQEQRATIARRHTNTILRKKALIAFDKAHK